MILYESASTAGFNSFVRIRVQSIYCSIYQVAFHLAPTRLFSRQRGSRCAPDVCILCLQRSGLGFILGDSYDRVLHSNARTIKFVFCSTATKPKLRIVHRTVQHARITHTLVYTNFQADFLDNCESINASFQSQCSGCVRFPCHGENLFGSTSRCVYLVACYQPPRTRLYGMIRSSVIGHTGTRTGTYVLMWSCFLIRSNTFLRKTSFEKW